MYKQHIQHKVALATIKRSRPFVNPNPGFVQQLRLYREMGYEFDPQHPAYIAYHKEHPLNADHAGHEN